MHRYTKELTAFLMMEALPGVVDVSIKYDHRIGQLYFSVKLESGKIINKVILCSDDFDWIVQEIYEDWRVSYSRTYKYET